MMPQPEIPAFQAFQYDFAQRLRNPQEVPLPGNVPQRRMAVYEELLFNNLLGFIGAAFPISQDILADTDWESLVRRFFIEHHCHSPLFRDIAGEFLNWVQPQSESLFPDRPWLWQFMHYEWLELAAEIAPDAPQADLIDPDGDLVAAEPALHPSVQLGCYHYPVHSISPQRQPTEADSGLHCYLVMRNADDQIDFTRLSPASAQLIELLLQGGRSGRDAILDLAGQMSLPQPTQLLDQGREILTSLYDSGAIIGAWRKRI